MQVRFVVFRVRDELQAALLLESVRFGLTKRDGPPEPPGVRPA